MSIPSTKQNSSLSKLVRLSKQMDSAIQSILTSSSESISEELNAIKASIAQQSAQGDNTDKNIETIEKILNSYNVEFSKIILGDIKRKISEFKTLGVIGTYQKQ